MPQKNVTVIIPAYNEETRIPEVIEETLPHAEEILVIDDHSTDDTAQVAKEAGATVLTNNKHSGYIEALKTGFAYSGSDIDVIVTMDGDGEHDPNDIPNLLSLIENGSADVVLGGEGGDRPPFRKVPLLYCKTKSKCRRLWNGISGNQERHC